MDPVSAIAAVLGVTSLIVWRVDPRFRRPPRSMVGLLEHAARLASERGQRPVTLSHLVLALLSNPEVGSFLDQHGIDDTDLLRELEKLLPPEIEGPSPDVTVSDFDGSLLRFIAPSRATAMGMLVALLESEGHAELREAFARHGVTKELLRLSPAPRTPRVADAGAGGPYRSTQANTTDLVLWNDAKTPFEFVRELMRVELVVPEPRATRLVLTVQVHDFAVVGTYQPAEAERLADRLRDLARAAGHPLEVTTAARGTAKRRFRLPHWLAARL